MGAVLWLLHGQPSDEVQTERERSTAAQTVHVMFHADGMVARGHSDFLDRVACSSIQTRCS